MNKILTSSALFVGLILLTGCSNSQPDTNQSPTVPAPKTEKLNVEDNNNPEIKETTNQEVKLSYCERTFLVDEKDSKLIDKILQLYLAKDKNYCGNLGKITNIAILSNTKDGIENITLYEKTALTATERKMGFEQQLEIIYSKSPIVQYNIHNESLYALSAMDGSEEFLGKIK